MRKEEHFLEQGQRGAEDSTRFPQHPSGDIIKAVIEMIHNILSYFKGKAWVRITDTGPKTCDYEFFNDASPKNLPTFEKIQEIARTAGKSISSLGGVSLQGVGTEIMILSSRPKADSIVTAEITIVRRGLKYGFTLTANGREQKITYGIKEPQATDEKNSYRIKCSGSKKMKPTELLLFKMMCADIMYGKNIDFEILNNNEVEKITPVDFLHREELNGTNNYEKHNFHFADGEPITLEMSCVRDIVQRGNGNKYENNALIPASSQSGLSFRYENIATICRGKNSWGLLGLPGKETHNWIRIDLSGGKTLFNLIHRESLAKTKTTCVLSELRDEYGRPLKIYDDEGKEYEIGEIAKLASKFCYAHRSDCDAKEKKENAIKNINDDLKDGTLSKTMLENALQFNQRYFQKMKVDTAISILQKIMEEESPHYCNAN